MAITSSETPYFSNGGLHIQLPSSSPNILKSSDGHDTHYHTARMGLRTAVPLTYSIDNSVIPMVSEVSCKIPYSSEVFEIERVNEPVVEDVDMDIQGETEENEQRSNSGINLVDLPEELQQHILDYVVGELRAVTSHTSGNGVRNWHYALRHSRAKDATNLALVTPLWSKLIQQRLYRHIRIQGTIRGLIECRTWFSAHPHLQDYVRHVEFWVPVWEKRPYALIQIQPLLTPNDLRQADSMQPISSNYQSCSTPSTVEEMFSLVGQMFSQVCVLTIEGGSCKKPPKIQLRRHEHCSIPVLANINTFVVKGAWTMIRDLNDYENIAKSLPNLKDWQMMYTAPKYHAYMVMNAVVPRLSTNLTHLHVCMDGFYSKKWLDPEKVEDLRQNHHLCKPLSLLLQQLEALTFSGRACYCLFTSAIELFTRNNSSRQPKLKTMDIALRNCCKDYNSYIGDANWAYNSNLIEAFERLVLAASASLKWFVGLKSMRVRFVDLDSPMASMNPYFQIKDQIAYGLYNDSILQNLMTLPTPIAFAHDLSGVDDGESGFPLNRRLPGRRPQCIHVSEYANFNHRR